MFTQPITHPSSSSTPNLDHHSMVPPNTIATVDHGGHRGGVDVSKDHICLVVVLVEPLASQRECVISIPITLSNCRFLLEVHDC